MSNIEVTHSPSGLVYGRVVRSERISPHFMRVTLGGDDLARFEFVGFDQWFRLAIPVSDSTRFDNLPRTFDLAGYLKYLTLSKDTRPVIRNYTVRQFRTDPVEMDIDFVTHGTGGIAAPWAMSVTPGAPVGLINQGCGFKPVDGADWTLLVGDASALPAIVGILRDMPRDAVGHAFIELPDAADQQRVASPSGMRLHWLTRGPHEEPGSAVMPAVRQLGPFDGYPYAFAVGEAGIATGVRRFLVKERQVPKSHVTFSGYWRQGPSAG